MQYRLDCGSGEGLVRVEGQRVDDGAWHTVRVERRGSHARLSVDGGPDASGTAPGPHDVLNLEGRDLHLGGPPEGEGGLVGCLDDAQLDGRPLPLHLRPGGPAQLRRLAHVQFGCRLQDPCLGQPCLHGATCRPLAAGGYTCACPAHFRVGAAARALLLPH